MKITKNKLKQIIKEELKIHEAGTLPWEEPQPADTSHAQQMLRKKVPLALEELEEVVNSYGPGAELGIGIKGSEGGDFFELTITVDKV